jgi:tetratricopeptide (TPR) repeat protein
MMKSRKTAPIILFGLILFFSGLRTSAQGQDWGKLTADARATHLRGDDAGAATLYKRALAIQVKVLGPNHPQVAASLNNLAVLYQDESQYAQAEPLYKRALAIWEKIPGADTRVAGNLNNLAALYHDER